MTEEEAKEKWCPFVRFTTTEGGFFSNRGQVFGSSDCIGSDCMAWVRERAFDRSKSDDGYYETDNGHCGLVK